MLMPVNLIVRPAPASCFFNQKAMKFTNLSLGLFAATAARLPSSARAFSSSAPAAATAAPQVTGARALGGSDLLVSEACLGTMTWGVQNDRADAFAQLDYARSKGCNFIDTAELYPVPLTAPEWRAGNTELILGEYLQTIGSSERDELVIASKIAGYFPNSPVAAERTVPPTDPAPDCRLDRDSVRQATDASLRRLQTDRVDLMQIHWPDRYVPAFGLMTYQHEQKRDDAVPIRETAAALKELIDEGKIRYIGLSNESTYGVCEWIKACEELGMADRVATIQNSYSLLDRRFDSELAEAVDSYNIGLLPWSVLAGGLLSGKYRAGSNKSGIASDDNSRFIKYPEYMTRWNPKTATEATLRAVDDYSQIAEEAGMTPSQLAIAFCRTRKFIADNGSVIVGATTVEQLKENMEPFDTPVELSDDILAKIDEIHMRCRDPCCSL